MKKNSAARYVIFATAFGSIALLASVQGCSSDSTDTPAQDDASTSSSSNSSSSSSSSSGAPDSGPKDSGTDAKKDTGTDAKSDADAGACLNDTVVGAFPTCPASCDDQCKFIAGDPPDGTQTGNLRKGVAAEAIKALTTAICTGNTTATATTTAVGKACTDKNAESTTLCAAFVTGGCSNAGFATKCVTVVNALTGTGTDTGNAGANLTGGRSTLYNCINNSNVPTCEDCLDFMKGKTFP